MIEKVQRSFTRQIPRLKNKQYPYRLQLFFTIMLQNQKEHVKLDILVYKLIHGLLNGDYREQWGEDKHHGVTADNQWLPL